MLDGSSDDSGESSGEDLDVTPPQTPPLDIGIPPLQQGRRRRGTECYQNKVRMDSDTLDQIPRPPQEIGIHTNKMLALPIPTIRPVDINLHREPGYMGINPVTLIGQTGLLPGIWGEGKEFVNTLAWHKPAGQQQQQEFARSQRDAKLRENSQGRQGAVVADLKELRMHYAQAVLDRDAFEESSAESSVIQRQGKTAEPEGHGR
jgi:hypothetical protein